MTERLKETLQPVRKLRMSLVVGAAMALCSVLPASLGSVEPWAGYVMLPGAVVGMYASVIVSGNPHRVEIAPLIIVGGIVNFAFYTTLCLVVLAGYSKVKRRHS